MRKLGSGDVPAASDALAGVRDKIAAVSRRLEIHNQLEETGIYELADGLFDATGRAKLNALVQKELNNLPPRFGGN
jgi:hypothetical protein